MTQLPKQNEFFDTEKPLIDFEPSKTFNHNL